MRFGGRSALSQKLLVDHCRVAMISGEETAEEMVTPKLKVQKLLLKIGNTNIVKVIIGLFSVPTHHI